MVEVGRDQSMKYPGSTSSQKKQFSSQSQPSGLGFQRLPVKKKGCLDLVDLGQEDFFSRFVEFHHCYYCLSNFSLDLSSWTRTLYALHSWKHQVIQLASIPGKARHQMCCWPWMENLLFSQPSSFPYVLALVMSVTLRSWGSVWDRFHQPSAVC